VTQTVNDGGGLPSGQGKGHVSDDGGGEGGGDGGCQGGLTNEGGS